MSRLPGHAPYAVHRQRFEQLSGGAPAGWIRRGGLPGLRRRLRRRHPRTGCLRPVLSRPIEIRRSGESGGGADCGTALCRHRRLDRALHPYRGHQGSGTRLRFGRAAEGSATARFPQSVRIGPFACLHSRGAGVVRDPGGGGHGVYFAGAGSSRGVSGTDGSDGTHPGSGTNGRSVP